MLRRKKKFCQTVLPNCEFTNFLKDGVRGKVKICSTVKNVKKIEQDAFKGSKIFYQDEEISFPLVGEHNLKNAMSCILFAEEHGFSAREIKAGLENVKPLFGRSQLKHGFVSYLLDCYNANPESTLEAIRFCDTFEISNAKHFVIASMLELGSAGEVEHEKIFEKALSSSADVLYFFGDEFFNNEKVVDRIQEEEKNGSRKNSIFCFKTDDFESLKKTVQEKLNKDDFVLLKGSRGLELERLESVLQDEEGKVNA